ncbi:MAG: putative manganese efflux pump MntP [Desulfovibrio sp.]
MAFVTLLALAVALAMDAFAVAVAAGMQLRCIRIPQTIRMAGTFGFFQFAMPVAGWFLGVGVQKYIEDYDHWVAFGLLAFVGGKMIKEAWEKRGNNPKEECAACPSDPTTGASLLLLGVATSIDALAVGLSMAILGQAIWFPAFVIGVVCAAITACGIYIGRAMCSFAGNWSNYANIAGGIVLIGIGANILREHGVF